MDSELLTQTILLVIGGAISLAVTLIVKRFSDKLDAADKTRQELAAKAEEQRKTDSAKTDALCHGIGLLLRGKLIDDHDKYQDLGCYMPTDRKDNFEEMYGAYEALGFDGVIAGLHKDVIRWPTAPPGGDAA